MKPKYNRNLRSQTLGASLVTAITICFGASAFAADNFWLGTTPDWNTPGNWSLGSVPTAPDDAVVNVKTPSIATITADPAPGPRDFRVGQGSGADGQVNHLSGSATTGGGNWAFVGRSGGTGVYNLADTAGTGGALTGFGQGSGSFTCNGSRLYVGGQNGTGGGNGTFNMNTTGSLTIGNDLAVGSSTGAIGVMNVDFGSITTGGWNFIGKDEGGQGGNGTLNMAGGTLTNNGGKTFVGQAGCIGKLNLSGGSYINPNDVFIVGENTGGNGTLTITNSDSELRTGGEFQISQGGGSHALVTFSNGLISSSSWVQIGRSGGNAVADMSGGYWNKTGGGAFIVGDNATGVLNLSGGTINSTGQFWVAQGGSGNGTLNLSDSGSITCGDWVAIGREGGTALVEMTGGTWTKINGGTSFIVASSGPGTMNQSGGFVDVQGGDTWIGESGTASLTLSADAYFRASYFQVARNVGSDGTVNLNGGTLEINRIDGGGGAEHIHFDGTQIIARSDEGGFIGGIDGGGAIVDAGGLLIDSANHNLTIPQVLLDGTSGKLVKTGEGILTLTAANTYSGTTAVNQGGLSITTASAAGGSLTMADSTTLGLTQTVDGAATTVSSANFGGDTTLNLNLGNFAGNSANAPLNVTGGLAVNGTVTVNITDTNVDLGVMKLVSYGSKTGSGSFVLGTLPDGVVAGPVVVSGGLVSINITHANVPYWTGTINSVWNTTDTNWNNQYGGALTNYNNGDPVLFDDRVLTGPTAITISGILTPGGSGVTFNNSTHDYTLTGDVSNRISGTTGVTKQGTGVATIAAPNTYLGVTTISGGTLSVATLTNGGIASPIGAANNSEANLILNSGTLYYTGTTTSIDRGFTTTAAGGGIGTDNTLTISGAASSTGTGNFSKTGPGNLKLTFDGNNVFGGGGMAGVSVLAGTLTLDGTGISQTNFVVGDIWVGTTSVSGADLVLNTTTLNSSGNYLAIARGSGTTGLTSTCTLTNSTLTTGNLSLGYANGLAGYSATSVLTLNDSSYTTGTNKLGESAGATGVVILNGASTMSSGDTNVGQGTGTNGTLDVKGTSVYTSNNRLLVGQDVGSVGNVVVGNSGSVVALTYVSVGFNGGGSMTVKNSGSFTTNDDLSINENGDVAANVTLQDTGTITVGNHVYVGRNGGRIGTFTQTGGTFNGNGTDTFQIGAGGLGSWLQSGGITNAGGWVSIGRNGGSTGVLTVSGTGAFNQTGTDRALIVGEDGTGTLSIQGTATVSSVGSNGLIVSNSATGVGTVNLDGGTLAAMKISDGGGSGTFNFNGGLLKAGTGANPAFMSGLDSVVVKTGGANIDSNGQTIAINQALLDGTGGGGLVKTGAGFLQLNASNTYAGMTTVTAGSLGGTGSVAGPLFVSAAGTLAPGASTGTFTAGASTISGTYACEIDGANADKLVSNGTLDVSAATLAITQLSAPSASPLIIASYTGSTPAPFASVTGLPAGYTVVYNFGNQIALVQTATPYTTWAQSNITAITPGADATTAGDPDGDGVSNITEFALDGNPLSGASTGKVVGKIASVNGDSTLVLTLPVRTGATFTGTTEQVSALIDGVIYRIQGSDELASWRLVVGEVTGADKTTIETGLPPVSTGWTYRTFQSPGTITGDPADFLRAVIVNP